MVRKLKTINGKRALSKITKNAKKYINKFKFKDILSQLEHVNIEIKEIKVKRTIDKDKTIMKFHKMFNNIINEYKENLAYEVCDSIYTKECLDKIFKNYNTTSKQMLQITSLGWELLYYNNRLFFKKKFDTPIPLKIGFIKNSYIEFEKPVCYLKTIYVDVITPKIYIDSIYNHTNTCATYYNDSFTLSWNTCNGSMLKYHKIDLKKMNQTLDSLVKIEANCKILHIDAPFYKPNIKYKEKSKVWHKIEKK